MERLVTSNLKLGIIAGGQLGKMLIQEASKWDIITYVLDNDESCPAGKVASHYIQGNHLEFESVYQFGKQVDVLTFEIESVNIDSIITSQFEQHLRAILNLPLGSTKVKLPSVMINILGEEGHEGLVMYEGLTESMAIDGVKIHLYGKKITKPYRKMGHATVMSSSLECALKKAEKVKQLIKVKSWKESG